MLEITPSQLLSRPPQSAPLGVQRQVFVCVLQRQPETQSALEPHPEVQRPCWQKPPVHSLGEVHALPSPPDAGSDDPA